MIYIWILLVVVFFSYLESIKKSRKFSQYSLILITSILIFFAGLRDKVGTDWDAYYEFYKNSTDKVEIGYSFLNNICGNLGLPYNLFLILINGFSLTLMSIFLKRHSILLIVGILIFYPNLYLYFNFSGIRQAIALSITCFSFRYALEKQFLKFIILVLLAATFHVTAIVFISVYFIPRQKFNFIHILFIIVISVFLNLFISSIADFISLYNLKDANFYVNLQEKSDSIFTFYLIGIFVRAIILSIIFIFRFKLFDLENFIFYFNIYLVGFFIFIFTYLISPDIGVRISSYFTIFDIIIIGNIIYCIQKLRNRIIIVTIFTLIAFYKIFGYMNSEFYNYNIIFKI